MSSYIGRSSDGFGILRKYRWVASGNETSIAPTLADSNGKLLRFTDKNLVHLFLNGVKLDQTDFNLNTTNQISGLAALAANDILEAHVYDVFSIATTDTVSATDGGTFTGATTHNGGITSTTGTFSGALSAKGGAVFNEDSADVDFRVESNGNANMINVDGGNDKVGLGISPSFNVQIDKSSTNTTLTDLTDAQLVLSNSGSATTEQHVKLGFRFQDGSYNGQAMISAVRESNSARSASLRFYTAPSSDGDPDERMRIDSAGRTGIRAVPSGWTSSWKGVDIGDQQHIGEYDGGSSYIAKNGYFDGSNWKYKESAAFSAINMDTGGFIYLQNGASGSADANITVTSGALMNADNFWKVRGGYGYLDSSGTWHEMNTNKAATTCLVGIANNASRTGIGMLMYHTVSHSNTNAKFFGAYSNYPGGTADLEFYVRNDGHVYADNNFNSGGADYAELFEWKDGNSSSEDRVGYSVVLDENKIRKATSDDSASNIIGVISGNPSVVGDADGETWNGQYLKDDFNRYTYKDSELYQWTETKTVGGNPEPQEIVYYKDHLPSDVTVPKDAVTTKCKVRVLNPDYDASKKDSYETREDRKEWSYVGMMGKLRMLKGQPTGDRWIKMRDISDTVEEWLVR